MFFIQLVMSTNNISLSLDFMLIHRMIHKNARGLDKISSQRGLKSPSMTGEKKSENYAGKNV